MSGNELKILIKYIKQDLIALFEGIEKHETQLKKLLDLIKKSKPIISSDFYGFSVLLRKYCFQNYDKNGINALNERIELIEKIFYAKNKIDFYNDHLILPFIEDMHIIPEPNQLFHFLYIRIFERMIRNSEKIEEIFHDLYNEWKDVFSQLKMKISIIVYLPIYAKIGEYKINEKISIFSRIPHIKIDDTEYNEPLMISYGTYITRYEYRKNQIDLDYFNKMKCYLNIETEIPIYKVETKWDIMGKERHKLRESHESIKKKIREIINTFYLFGYEFEFKGYLTKYPWWFEFDTNYFDNLDYNIEYYDGITNENIVEFISLYEKVVKSCIFLSEDFEIISYRYHQIHGRDYLPDIVIDANIILEIIYTRNVFKAIRSTLSRNCALFISRFPEEFEKFSRMLKKLYELRSTIVHGGPWEEKIEKLIKDKIFSNKGDIKKQLILILNRTLKRLIQLKSIYPNILENLKNRQFFIENSELNKNHSQYLRSI